MSLMIMFWIWFYFGIFLILVNMLIWFVLFVIVKFYGLFLNVFWLNMVFFFLFVIMLDWLIMRIWELRFIGWIGNVDILWSMFFVESEVIFVKLMWLMCFVMLLCWWFMVFLGCCLRMSKIGWINLLVICEDFLEVSWWF